MKCPLCKGHFDSNQDKWRKSRRIKGKCCRCNGPVRLESKNKDGTIHKFAHCDACLLVLKIRCSNYRKRKKEIRLGSWETK